MTVYVHVCVQMHKIYMYVLQYMLIVGIIKVISNFVVIQIINEMFVVSTTYSRAYKT